MTSEVTDAILKAEQAQQRAAIEGRLDYPVQLKMEGMPVIEFKKGDKVKAFHPGKFGVISHGVVVNRGSKYARIDFGELGGGIRKVPHNHITEVVNT